MKLSISKTEKQRHLIIWVLVLVALTLIDPATTKDGNIHFPGTFIIVLSYFIIFYLIIFSLIWFWDKSKVMAITSLLILFLISFSMDYMIFDILFPYFGLPDYFSLTSFNDIFVQMGHSLIPFSMVSLIASGYFYNKTSIFKLNEANKKELQLMEKELNFLKSQFSSHVIFNFLNYIYYDIHDKSERSANAIINFADILKYTMRIKPSKKVKLKEEIEYIEKFIKLQEVLTERICVDFNYNMSNENLELHPYILVSFVENALKHGRINDPENPVEIKLSSTNNSIEFSIKNKKEPNKNHSTGIGLANAKSMLEMFYNKSYNLSIDENENFYFVKLKLYHKNVNLLRN